MRIPSTLAVALLMPITAATAKPVFVAQDRQSPILHGSGGSSMRSHGITVWTRGMPPGGFHVLGVIRDVRTDKLLDGNALTSAAVAKLVREHGGDAVLARAVGTMPIAVERGGSGGVLGSPSYSMQGDRVVQRVTTDLVVIQTDSGA